MDVYERTNGTMKEIREFAKNTLIVMCLMAFGWTICVIGLGALGVL